MQVTGHSYEQLHEALVNAFDFNSLQAVLEFALRQRLDLLAGRSDEFSTTVFRVIKEYNRRDQGEKLVQVAMRRATTLEKGAADNGPFM
jgi:hypothetical protein